MFIMCYDLWALGISKGEIMLPKRVTNKQFIMEYLVYYILRNILWEVLLKEYLRMASYWVSKFLLW
jgi:hypothetical protein